MLEVVSTVRSPSKAVLQHAGFPTPDDCGEDEFMVVDDDVNLLDCYIDFTCCDVVPSLFDADGDVLPDLEVDPTEELLAEFEDQTSTVVVSPVAPAACSAAVETKPPPDDDDKEESPGGGSDEEEKDQRKNIGRDNEALMMSAATTTTTTEDSAAAMEAAAAGSSSSDDSTTKSSASADKGGEKNKKTKTSSKNSHGGSKKKVDWTPELHRRFVQAVEQLGIDKAVPTRIREIMGIDSLTRHNIASHLQKYRSHRKHLMEREAEAATWAQKRHMRYAAAANTGVQVVPTTTKKDMPAAAGPPWVMPPTIGFPPFGVRPLHVWGHPPPTAVEGMLLPLWPRHLQAPTTRPPAYWHQQQYNNAAAARKWGPQTVARGAPCVTPPRPPAAGATLPARFPVPGMTTTMPAHPMYRRPIIPPTRTTQSSSSISKTIASLQLQLDAHPSKESIDAAIGDVLVKPWLPLPLGLKPPSLDSVMSELHKQGIPDIPPPARPGHQRQLADPSYGSSIQ